jgi:hypothetical protein
MRALTGLIALGPVLDELIGLSAGLRRVLWCLIIQGFSAVPCCCVRLILCCEVAEKWQAGGERDSAALPVLVASLASRLSRFLA